MAQSQAEWRTWFIEAGIPAAESAQYAATFVTNGIQDAADLTNELLRAMDITVIGDCMAILKHAKKNKGKKLTARTNVDPPPIKSEMTTAEFRKWITDWDVYRQISDISGSDIALYIYNACDEDTQSAIVNTEDNFFAMDFDDILVLLQNLVTKKSNPAVHRLTFSNLIQGDNEAVKDFVVRLKSAAKDCEFACPNPECLMDLQPNHVMDQLIRGIRNTALQTDILAKAESLKTLNDIVKHAEAFEAAMHDQSQLSSKSEVNEARTNQNSKYNNNRQNNSKSRKIHE